MPRSLPAVLILIMLAGCSAVVRSTPLGPTYEPRPAGADVQLFSVRAPECSYDEIALLIAYSDHLAFVSTADAVEGLKRRVRKLGGDGVVGLTQFPPSGDDGNGGVKGTAIRFRDPACRH